MAKFIIRDSEGNVEKIVDKKMHRDRKYQGGGGYGCLCLLVVVVGLIIYFSLIKDKNKNTGDEETTNAEYVHLGKKKTVKSSRGSRRRQHSCRYGYNCAGSCIGCG